MEELALLKKHILEGRYTDALAVVEDMALGKAGLEITDGRDIYRRQIF